MKNLVIGLGEVGSAIRNILDCEGYDPMKGDFALGADNVTGYEVLHICFPWSDDFVSIVKKYQERWKPDMVIVHSSVPVGTCDPERWVHSPVRGVHPNLEEGIRTFVKYFGGERAAEAGVIFNVLGIPCIATERARNTEALKLLDTTQYGMMIKLQKEIHAWCVENNVDYLLAYEEANQTYNEGYMKLGRPEVVRPYLKNQKGKIGGHCVIPNAHLIDAPFAKELLAFNDTLE